MFGELFRIVVVGVVDDRNCSRSESEFSFLFVGLEEGLMMKDNLPLQ